MDERWLRYLFESHPESILRDWAKRLSLFRFFRAYGGHANDADALELVFRYQSLEELLQFFAWLEVPLVHLDEPVSTDSKHVSIIPNTTWIVQPGRCVLNGHEVFVWCSANQIKMSLGENYVVTEADVVTAEALEQLLKHSPLERIDPPLDSRNYICPKYYPEYFS